MATSGVVCGVTQNTRTVDNRPISAAMVALEATPVEAERLAIAQAEGRIQLVLRGYGDPDSLKTEGAKTADVLAQLRGAPAFKEPERVSSSSRKQSSAAAPAQVAPAPILHAPPPPV